MKKFFWILIFTSFLFCTPFPKCSGVITDEAGVLPLVKQTDLLELIDHIKKRNDVKVAVATIKSLNGEDIAKYTVDLARHWGIGDRGKDNGVLILLVSEEKRVQIAIGYGVEGVLTDALTKNIIEEDMLGELKKGDFPKSVKNALNTMYNILSAHIKNDKQDLKISFKDTHFLEFDYGKFASQYKYGFFEQKFNFFEVSVYFVQIVAFGFVMLFFNAYKKNRYASFAYALIAFGFDLAVISFILVIIFRQTTIDIYTLSILVISITAYCIYFGRKYPGETYFDGNEKDPIMRIVFTMFVVLMGFLSFPSLGGSFGGFFSRGGGSSSGGGGSFGGGGASGGW